MRTRSLFPTVLLIAVAPCRGQDPVRWLADLGDPARGEAAEIALLGTGERAAPLLLGVLREKNHDAAARRARQRAALRVLALLGPDAAAVTADLADVVVEKELLLPWMHACAALEPWAAHADWLPALYKASHALNGDWIAQMTGLTRYQARMIPVDLDTTSLLDRLAKNRIFEREAVADLLGRKGDRQALEPLCSKLRERNVAPAGHDSFRHNGFAVPVEDGFRFAASEAVLRLAPDDPRAAIAWSGRALLHPHRTVRLAALAAVARFAPAIDDTVPDLLAIARGDDKDLAAEAIKLMGMAQSGGASCIGELERLAAGSAGDVAVRTGALVVRLHAAGISASPRVETTVEPKVVAAVAALGHRGNEAAAGAAWDTVVTDGGVALPLLLERLRVERDDTPDAVVAAIARIGRDRPAEERADLRAKMYFRCRDVWSSDMGSCSSGGHGSPPVGDRVADGELALGSSSDPSALASALGDDSATVRLAAAMRLAGTVGAADCAARSDVRDQLIAAVRAEHPKKWEFQVGNMGYHEPIDLDAAIHAAAAAALAAFDLPAEQRAEFLPLLRAGHDVEAIARGLRRWAAVATLPALREALTDRRGPVAIAAADAIGSLGHDAAAFAPALREAAADPRAEVAAAARAALQAVGQ